MTFLRDAALCLIIVLIVILGMQGRLYVLGEMAVDAFRWVVGLKWLERWKG